MSKDIKNLKPGKYLKCAIETRFRYRFPKNKVKYQYRAYLDRNFDLTTCLQILSLHKSFELRRKYIFSFNKALKGIKIILSLASSLLKEAKREEFLKDIFIVPSYDPLLLGIQTA